ncbi:hypothetical protein Z957_05485 [Clostridium sp. K25]|uniref:Uncharacterized protein n=1 Tax=Clostridium botulinum D str. 1873 TaxID=592027 RepID=A0A9P2G6X4_CLOBO|nr:MULTISPECIES: hypothetical protein [Clostridium]AYF54494.1 hypothetical protein DFH04_07140 [Clostridium novyi]EES91080.1 conserved hypothetical protein [Clostridium botulinum D str. 1873]KEI09092.1 hypothetical protein Z957_05485 [Clostridium sp. K25]MBO3441284.1 hypothetical protein [Clostridium haemolyticum]MCD3217115.1 hypothetical protein [Clostridium botulinum C]
MEEITREPNPIKKVVFKRNTFEELGVVVNLTKGKAYDLLSVKIPAQYEVKPSMNNVVLYLIEDDNGERKYFSKNFFER